jgi:hypothetical protein
MAIAISFHEFAPLRFHESTASASEPSKLKGSFCFKAKPAIV